MESDFDRGERLLSERDYRGAVAAYEAAEKKEPGSPRTSRQLGMAYAAVGERSAAINFLEVWSLHAPGDTTGRLTLAQLYLADGRVDDAIREANLVLDKAPSSLNALTIAGAGYAAKHDAVKAVDTYRKIAEVAPKDPKALYLAGTGLGKQGVPTEALAQFESALAIAPTNYAALEQVVSIDIASGHSDAAVARVKKQIGVVGDSVALTEMLAIAHAAHGEQKLAESELLDVIKKSPSYLAPYVRLSELYRDSRRYDEALAMLDRANKVDPKSKDLHLVEGMTYEAKGDRQGAIRAYHAALAIDPKFSTAGNNLAMLLAESGTDLDKALQVITAASAADPTNPAITDTFGWVLFKRGDYAGAVAKFKDVVVKLPNEPTVAYHIGIAEAKAGDAAGARRDLQRALSSPVKFPERDAVQKALSALK